VQKVILINENRLILHQNKILKKKKKNYFKISEKKYVGKNEAIFPENEKWGSGRFASFFLKTFFSSFLKSFFIFFY